MFMMTFFTKTLNCRPHLLQHGPVLISKFPRLKFMVDHIAKPYIKAGTTDGWKEGMADIAKYPNVYCKISGMVTEADLESWKKEDFLPYVKHIIDVFGVDRCVYGSDWPVCIRANADYKRQLQLAHEIFDDLGLSKEDKKSIFYQNAIEFYGLKL